MICPKFPDTKNVDMISSCYDGFERTNEASLHQEKDFWRQQRLLFNLLICLLTIVVFHTWSFVGTRKSLLLKTGMNSN